MKRQSIIVLLLLMFMTSITLVRIKKYNDFMQNKNVLMEKDSIIIDTLQLPSIYFINSEISKYIAFASFYASSAHFILKNDQESRYNMCLPDNYSYPTFLIFIKPINNDTCQIRALISEFAGAYYNKTGQINKFIFDEDYKIKYVWEYNNTHGLILIHQADTTDICKSFIKMKGERKISIPINFFPIIQKTENKNYFEDDLGCFDIILTVTKNDVHLKDFFYYPLTPPSSPPPLTPTTRGKRQ